MDYYATITYYYFDDMIQIWATHENITVLTDDWYNPPWFRSTPSWDGGTFVWALDVQQLLCRGTLFFLADKYDISSWLNFWFPWGFACFIIFRLIEFSQSPLCFPFTSLTGGQNGWADPFPFNNWLVVWNIFYDFPYNYWE